ncbi:hypothetical protein CROQUDRAFT_99472 [Cronartium quercuum f. sp. fusiforme G11]|uniref:Uncharacterized protein n=1 Tax=Cronartium quercuum f. sp. fusiforme G11 TaxID=708437 RepID=A0A9P6NBV8_9BASI|nr:hypothetical protein CROQUDRAFT_99472 [Cronartium quercuum f. sp. fusiforme G11]
MPVVQNFNDSPLQPPTQPSVPSASISASFLEYSSLPNPTYYNLPGMDYSEVILDVDLMVGGKTIRAQALADSGSTGDFMSCKFVHQHGFHLLP